MTVKLRLTRRGKKKQPTYRVVAAEAHFPRDGRFIEIIGFYNPRIEPSEVRIDNEKALKWLRSGAQPSERVQKLLEVSGAWEEFTGKAPVFVPAKSKQEKRASKKEKEAKETVAEEVPAEEKPKDEKKAESKDEKVEKEAKSKDEKKAEKDTKAEEAPAEEEKPEEAPAEDKPEEKEEPKDE